MSQHGHKPSRRVNEATSTDHYDALPPLGTWDRPASGRSYVRESFCFIANDRHVHTVSAAGSPANFPQSAQQGPRPVA